MSTRCNIIITGRFKERFYLYHHHDGYPEGVGVQLRKVLQENANLYRYGQPFYLANGLIKDKYGLNDKEYEVTTGLHSDIEFCYVINLRARTLRCYEVGWDERPRDIFRRDNLVDIPEWDGKPTMYERHI